MEKKVKDIMVPIERCPAIPAGSSIKEAVTVLNKALETGPCAGNTFVLVMKNNTIMGLVGFREIMGAVEPQVFKGGTFRGWTVPAEWSPPLFLRGAFTQKCDDLSQRRVEEIMRPVEQQLQAEDTLMKAVHTIITVGFENIPVWQDGRVVGVVGNLEIIDEIAELQRKGEKELNTGTRQVAG